jgi:hypothetical protein
MRRDEDTACMDDAYSPRVAEVVQALVAASRELQVAGRKRGIENAWSGGFAD